jgi:polyphenol oxidase
MPFHQSGSLRYFTFDSFDRHNLPHGLFARHGGVSPQPWESLNLATTVGDTRENVIENRQRIFDVFDRPVESIYDTWQVHGTEAIRADLPRPLTEPPKKADAILTGRKEITLFMRFADCVPVFLFDPEHQVIAIAHAGWRGTLDRIAAITVERMTAEFGTRPANVLAGIGPSICVDHYEIGKDPQVVASARQVFGARAGEVLAQTNGSIHLDLWKANQIILEEIGVQQVEQSGVCTHCQNQDWYSHRGEHGKTGRYGALLAMP